MKAKKENKVYNINEIQKQAYLKEGFDIYDDNGELIEYSSKKTITYNEHIKIINKLKEDASKNDNSKLTVQVEELTKANEALTNETSKLTGEKAELIAQVEELTKANRKLIEDLKKATK